MFHLYTCKETETIQLHFQKRGKKGEYFPLQNASNNRNKNFRQVSLEKRGDRTSHSLVLTGNQSSSTSLFPRRSLQFSNSLLLEDELHSAFSPPEGHTWRAESQLRQAAFWSFCLLPNKTHWILRGKNPK